MKVLTLELDHAVSCTTQILFASTATVCRENASSPMAKRHTLNIYDHMTSRTSLRLRWDNQWKLMKTMAKCGFPRTSSG
ncbi:hypothetical protein Aduo_003651 [Ancylostoma duodenale]